MSEFVGYLDDAHHDFVWVTIGINQAELYHGVVAINVTFDVDDLASLNMLLNVFLKNDQCIGKVDFERAWIIRYCFH